MQTRKTILALLLLLALASPAWSQKHQPAAAPSPTATPETKAEETAPAPASQSSPVDQSDDRLPFMTESAREEQQAAPSTGGLMLRTLGALLLIVGLIVAAAWGMKRFGGARFGKAVEDAPNLVVLNSVGLGDKRSIAVVRFGSRTMLIGSTAQSITLLAEEQDQFFRADLPSVAEMLGETEAITFADRMAEAEIGGPLEQW
jgi:flagellar biosynthetic protein FliO